MTSKLAGIWNVEESDFLLILLFALTFFFQLPSGGAILPSASTHRCFKKYCKSSEVKQQILQWYNAAGSAILPWISDIEGNWSRACQLKGMSNGTGNFRAFRYFGRMEDLERLAKIFEMYVPEKTVPFDSRPKISEFLPIWIVPRVFRNTENKIQRTSEDDFWFLCN